MLQARTRLILVTAVSTLLGAGVLGAIAGTLVLVSGVYDIGATTAHLPTVYKLLEQGKNYSVRHHAQSVLLPPLGGHDQVLRGAALYRTHCEQCHGGPGVAPDKHGLSMQPVPGPLVDATTHWRTREIYWITRHGIKMAGMPAWEYHMSDADIWATTAFVAQLQTMSVQDYKTMTAAAVQGAAVQGATAQGAAP